MTFARGEVPEGVPLPPPRLSRLYRRELRA